MNFISYKKSDLYDRVVDEYGIFENSYDFMVFLAVMGYQEGNVVREGYEGDDSNGTRGQIGAENFFANDLYRVIASSIAFQDTDDPSALASSELQAEKLAQYAAGGLEIAEREFGQTAGDPTNAIVNYIKSHQDKDGYQGTLGEIVKAFDDQMMGVEES
jgi:dnd system-associated protein 4